MPGFDARIWTQQQLGYVEHTSVSGDTWQCHSKGTSSGSGSATTLVDATRTEADDFFNGRYWLRIMSGGSDRQWARIVDFANATGTFTIENNGFSASIGSGVDYEVWLSPEPVIVVDSSGSATNIVDTVRTEANDFWIGYYIVPITGNRRGEVQAVTDSTNGGTFTTDAFTGVLAAGDVCLIRRFVEYTDLSAGVTQEYIPRPGNRVNFSMGDGIVGPKSGTVSFSTHIYPSNGTAADGTKAQMSACAGLLKASGLEETVGTSEVISGSSSTTTVLDITTGTQEQFSIGQMVVVNNEARFITQIADGGGGVDQLTISPALSKAPAAGDLVIASRMYAKSTDGDIDEAVTLEWEVDGVRTTMTGCRGNVTINDATAPTFAFEFNVDHWVWEVEAAPYNAVDAYTSATATLSQDRRFWLDTTAKNVNGITASPGTVVARRNVQGSVGINGGAGFQITGYAAGLTFSEMHDAGENRLRAVERWDTRVSYDLKVVMGAASDYFGLRIPDARLIELPVHTDQDGLMYAPHVVGAMDAGTTSNTGDGSIVKVPDWSVHLT